MGLLCEVNRASYNISTPRARVFLLFLLFGGAFFFIFYLFLRGVPLLGLWFCALPRPSFACAQDVRGRLFTFS
jgi:hypothetical protein